MAVFEYAPALESAALAPLRSSYGLFTGGEFIEAAGGSRAGTVNPATGLVLAEVAAAGDADVDRAVRAARTAYEGVWGSMPGRERAKYLFRLARLIQERASELAVLESLDTGRPVREIRAVDLPLVAAHVFYHAGWADKLRYALPGGGDPRPAGVVAQVLPWHQPLLLLAGQVAPALAAGDTVVVKPAGAAPLAALAFAEICQQADLPPGVVNVVTGGARTGQALVAHPGVDLVSFAGAAATGKRVARAVACSGTRLLLDLGGPGTNVVFDDAPVDEAVEAVVTGAFVDPGPLCRGTSRLLVQESVADLVLASIRRRMSRLRVGDPLDRNTDVGAIHSAAHLDLLRELVAAPEEPTGGLDEESAPDPAGATPDLPGAGPDLPDARPGPAAVPALRWSVPYQPPAGGFWFPPTLLTGGSAAHRAAREQVSGPVLAVFTFRTPAEAVAKANNTPYGFPAGVWSEKGSRVLWVADRLRTGVVWGNSFNRVDPSAPFGGYKESGYGRHGGRHGLEAYVAH